MLSSFLKYAFTALVLVFANPKAVAQSQQILGQTPTDWKGISFQVIDLLRTEENRVLAVIRIYAGEEANNPTEISVPSPHGQKPPGYVFQSEEERALYLSHPFSLASAVLVDETTKQSYKALPTPSYKPFKGPNEILLTLAPGQRVQLAVQFPAPPPIFDEGGMEPDKKRQRITLLLPRAKQPIRGLILPPEKN